MVNTTCRDERLRGLAYSAADHGLWPLHRSRAESEDRAALDRALASAGDRRHVLRAPPGFTGSACRQDHRRLVMAYVASLDFSGRLGEVFQRTLPKLEPSARDQ